MLLWANASYALVALDMAAAFKVRCEPGSSHLLTALRPGPMVDCGRDGATLPEMIGRERMWKLVLHGHGHAVRSSRPEVLRTGYTVVRRDAAAPSPFDPTKARFSWPDALLWAVRPGSASESPRWSAPTSLSSVGRRRLAPSHRGSPRIQRSAELGGTDSALIGFPRRTRSS